MEYRYLFLIAILDITIVFNDPSTCYASSIPSSSLSSTWGDMEDFIRFIQAYGTVSHIITGPDYSNDLPRNMDHPQKTSFILVSM